MLENLQACFLWKRPRIHETVLRKETRSPQFKKNNLCIRFNHHCFNPYWHVFRLWQIVVQKNELLFIQKSRILDPLHICTGTSIRDTRVHKVFHTYF